MKNAWQVLSLVRLPTSTALQVISSRGRLRQLRVKVYYKVNQHANTAFLCFTLVTYLLTLLYLTYFFKSPLSYRPDDTSSYIPASRSYSYSYSLLYYWSAGFVEICSYTQLLHPLLISKAFPIRNLLLWCHSPVNHEVASLLLSCSST
ncbi:hypothetical protein F5B17DRAFT_180577 [Nemania serpens]|nr:hypothetical protein F5B17DRAFT_180577 [Nemania serpens]